MAIAVMNCNTIPVSSAHSDTISSVDLIDSAAAQVDVKEQIILVCNTKYFQSHDCPLRVVQLMSTFVCLALATSCRSHAGDYLSLPFTDNLRLYVFICIFALLIGLFIVGLRLSSAVIVLPIDWNLFDMVIYGMLSMLFLVASLLAVGDLANFTDKHQILPQQAYHVYAVAMVFALLSSFLHGVTAVLGCRRRQWIECFGGMSKPQRILLSQQSSVSTVTTEAAT